MVKYLLLLCVSVSVLAQDESESDENDNSKRPSWSSGLPERQKTSNLNKPNFRNELDNDIEIDMSEIELRPDDIGLEIPLGQPTVQPEEEQDAVEEKVEEVVEVEPAAQVEEVVEQEVSEPEPVEEIAEKQTEQPPETVPVDSAPAQIENPVAEEQVQQQEGTVPVEKAPATAVEVVEVVDEEQNNDDVSLSESAINETGNISEATVASINPPEQTSAPDPAELAAKELKYEWRIIKQAPVEYPMEARRNNQEGWVDVEVTIDQNGNVVEVKTAKTSRRGRVFSKPALQSVKDWQFDPPVNQGIAQQVSRIYKIEFKL